MEACEDPPRPSVAAVRTPSVATKGLLLARIRPAKPEPSEIGSASSSGSSIGLLNSVRGFRMPKWLGLLSIYELTE